MSANMLLDAFSVVTRAPNGMTKVRDLIAYFAISGGLSDRQEGDTDAREILDDSLAQKEAYLRSSGNRRSQRKHAQLIEVARSVPSHWVKINAGDLIELINGRAFKSTEWRPAGTPIIRIQNLNDHSAPFNYFEGDADERHQVSNGDMLLSWSGTPGTSFGAFIWNRGDAVLNQHIFKVVIFSKLIDNEYLRIAINACLDVLIGSARGGVGLKHVTKGQIESLQIPIPPLEEQQRIVAKVDELMGLCDRLELQLAERAKLLPLLSCANHDRFVQEPTEENLKAVFTESPVSRIELRKTILSLAMRGKLAQQVDVEGSALELLAQIEKRRRELVSQGRLGRTRSRSIVKNDYGYEIPRSWTWCHVEDIATVNLGGTPSRERAEFWNGEVRWVSSGEVANCHIRDTKEHITELGLENSNAKVYPVGTVLIAMIGQGKTRGQAAILDVDASTNQNVAALVFESGLIDSEYVWMWALHEYQRTRSEGRGGAQPALNGAKIRALKIPIPPTNEQQRIVSTAKRLLALVDELEKQTSQSDRIVQIFIQAAIESITGLENTEKTPMKAPRNAPVTKVLLRQEPIGITNSPLAKIVSASKTLLSGKELWQRSGLSIDEFYRQLKVEIANGWIAEPEPATVKEVEVD